MRMRNIGRSCKVLTFAVASGRAREPYIQPGEYEAFYQLCPQFDVLDVRIRGYIFENVIALLKKWVFFK